ncbi:MAG: hypothetical protein Kow0062_29200 [Acidobacteriota bacterium]
MLAGAALAASAADGAAVERSLASFTAERGPLRLETASSRRSLWIPVARRVALERVVLHLELTNSIALLGERSQLTVAVGGRVVGQIPLAGKRPLVEADLPIDPALLEPGYNELQFRVSQHYTMTCEDPAAPELWTEIDLARSHLRAVVVPRAWPVRLSELGDVFDRRLWDRYALELLVPPRDDDDVLRPAALAVQGVARRLRYVPPRLVVSRLATRRTRPLVEELAGRDRLALGLAAELAPLLGERWTRTVDGPVLAVRPLPRDPAHVLVVITGRNDDELLDAALAFAHLEQPLPDAARTTIERVELPDLATYSAPGAVHVNGEYRFADLGFETTTLRGLGPGGVNLEFTMPPDLFGSEDRHVELSLHLAYGAALRRDSVLNLMLNGRFENVIHLDEPDGAVFRDYRISIPLRSFEPGANVLSFVPRWMPEVTGECQAIQDGNLMLTLFDDSRLIMPDADHVARLPDLRLLARTGYPFTVDPQGGRLAVRLGDREPQTVAAALTLLARISQHLDYPLRDVVLGTAPPPPDRDVLWVAAEDTLDEEFLAGAPVVVSGEASEVGHPQVVGRRPWERPRGPIGRLLHWIREGLPETVPADRRPAPATARTRQRTGLGRYAVLMEYERPDAPGRAVVLLTAADRARLAAAAGQLVDGDVWFGLEGDTAMWRDPDSLETARLGDSFIVGTRRASARLAFLFSLRPLLAVLVVALLLAAATFVARRLLRMRRERLDAASAADAP